MGLFAKWVRVAAVDDFNEALQVTVGGKEYALFKIDGDIYCLDNVCSHEYSPLAEGEIFDGDVYCPKHGSRFDVKTGEVKSFPATKGVRTFEVKCESGELFIKI